MKVRPKYVRQDSVCVDDGDRMISIHTHHHKIVLSCYQGKKANSQQLAYHELSFDSLFELIKRLAPGINDHL